MADLSALATRIAHAIATAETQPPGSQPKAVLFRLRGVRLALPLGSVREVVVLPERLSRVPRAPAALLGIMNLRGRVIAVVDLVQALPGDVSRVLPPEDGRAPSDAPGVAHHVLILERDRREVGLLVDAVDGLGALSDSGEENPVVLDPVQLAEAIDALVT